MDPGSKDMGRKMWNVQRSWESVPEEQEEELAAATAEPKGVQAEYFRRFKEAEEDKRLRTVHIAGLAKEATEEDVRLLCKQFGDVEALRMDKDNDGECFALVEFKERGSAQVVKRQEKYLVEERVIIFTEAKTMVDTTSFAEQSVQFNQPAFDQKTMKVVLAYQCNLNPKLAKARVAALQIAGEEIPKELMEAANQTGKVQEEAPVVWEGRGEQSSPLNQKESPVQPKEDRKRTRDEPELRRRGRRRRDSRDQRRRSRSRPTERKAEAEETKETPKKTFGKKVAALALHSEGQEEAEDEVEAVPNTELLVLGSSESYSYEWSGDEEEIIKAKAARQAAKEERRRKLEERRAEVQRKADEERQKAEEQRLEAERKAEEERQEAECRAAEAKAREAEAEAKRKADEDIALVRSSSQEYIQAAVLRRRLERLASKESTTSQATEKWECVSCGEYNKAERQRCNNCGAPAPWVPKSFEVDDAVSEASSSSSVPKLRADVAPLSPKSIADSLPRSVAESPPRSIPGSSPRSIAESKAESIQDETGDVVALSDEDAEVQVESAKVCGELAEARARIFHSEVP